MMKPRKQACSKCDGKGWKFNYYAHNTVGIKEQCPYCDGTGEGILISPSDWEEYRMMKKHWKKLNDIYNLHQIRAGNFILTDLKGKPLDAVSNNQGKIDIK